MRFPRPTFNQWLMLMVFFALCYNTYVHYSHPAYRYYRASVLALRADYDRFRRQVVNDFVPAITNVQFRLSSSFSSFSSSTNSFDAVVHGVTNSVSDAVRPPLRFGRYFECNGVPYVTLGVRYYTVGDEIMGYRVRSLAPGVVQLGSWYYEYSDSTSNVSSF